MKKFIYHVIFFLGIFCNAQTHFTTKWKVSAGIGFETISFYAATSTASATDNIIYRKSDGIVDVQLIESFYQTTATAPKLVTLSIPKSMQETTVNIQIPNIITFKLNGSEVVSQATPPALDTNATPSKFLDVIYWGTSPWQNLKYAFAHVDVATISATDSPNFSVINPTYGVTNLSRMFYESKIVTVNNINNWNVTPLRSFYGMFEFARYFNSDISNWVINSSGTVGMKYMFRYAERFNKPLHNWNVSTVIEADLFLQFAYKYNHPLPSFSSANLTNLTGFLYSAQDFNQELNNVNFKKITNVSQAFSSTFSRSPFKNSLLLDQFIRNKETDGNNFSNFPLAVGASFLYHDPTSIFITNFSGIFGTIGQNTYTINNKYPVGSIYGINASITNTNYGSRKIGVYKERIISPSNIIRGEEFIADELYLETPIVGGNAASTDVTLKKDNNNDVTLYSISYFSNSKNVKPIVNTNQYNVGAKSVVYKKDTTIPQDVSVDGTIVYDFTDNHLYVSKGGVWHRADN